MDTGNGAIQFDLLSGMAEQESSLCPDELAQVDEFVKLTKEHDGLILCGVVPELLQVSKTRWFQIRKKYQFQRWDLFGHVWHSRKELEAFSKLDRRSGRGRPSLVKIIKTLHAEAVSK